MCLHGPGVPVKLTDELLGAGYQSVIVRMALVIECLVNDRNGKDVGDGDATKLPE